MHDAAVSGAFRGIVFGPIAPRNIPPRAAARAADDALLARVLITSRSLVTGRTLRADVPPQLLTEQELIDFWADDQDPGPGGAA